MIQGLSVLLATATALSFLYALAGLPGSGRAFVVGLYLFAVVCVVLLVNGNLTNG